MSNCVDSIDKEKKLCISVKTNVGRRLYKRQHTAIQDLTNEFKNDPCSVYINFTLLANDTTYYK